MNTPLTQTASTTDSEHHGFFVKLDAQWFRIGPSSFGPETPPPDFEIIDLGHGNRSVVDFRMDADADDPVSLLLLDNGGAIVCFLANDLPPTGAWPSLRYDTPQELDDWHDEWSSFPSLQILNENH